MLCNCTRHSIRTILLQSVVHEPMSSLVNSHFNFANCQSRNFLHFIWRSRNPFRWTSFVTSNFVHNLIELLTVRSSGSEWLDCLRSFLVLFLISASSQSHAPPVMEIYGIFSFMLSARPDVTMNFNQRFTSPTADRPTDRYRANKQQTLVLWNKIFSLFTVGQLIKHNGHPSHLIVVRPIHRRLLRQVAYCGEVKGKD